MSQYIKTFKELSYKDVKIAGGKGASLGEMARNKIPVPDGFVVLAPAFEKFLLDTDLGVEIDAVIKQVKPKEIDNVEEASEKIRDMIADAEFPKDLGKEIKYSYNKLFKRPLLNPLLNKERRQKEGLLVAVRSSATAEDSSVASWAGELESYLNVTENDLLKYVKKCWSSLFTPRAIFYRFEKKLQDQKVSVAVVIQKMVQSDVAGICFTVHPVTRDKNQMIIEAGYGLGEAIVGGKITPDTYIIKKSQIPSAGWRTKSQINSKSRKTNYKTSAILDKNISEQKIMIVRAGAKGTKEMKVPKAEQNKQKISDKLILKLAKICLNIEKHYNKPQDIEWAIEKKKIYITQSRPITTL